MRLLFLFSLIANSICFAESSAPICQSLYQQAQARTTLSAAEIVARKIQTNRALEAIWKDTVPNLKLAERMQKILLALQAEGFQTERKEIIDQIRGVLYDGENSFMAMLKDAYQRSKIHRAAMENITLTDKITTDLRAFLPEEQRLDLKLSSFEDQQKTQIESLNLQGKFLARESPPDVAAAFAEFNATKESLKTTAKQIEQTIQELKNIRKKMEVYRAAADFLATLRRTEMLFRELEKQTVGSQEMPAFRIFTAIREMQESLIKYKSDFTKELDEPTEIALTAEEIAARQEESQRIAEEKKEEGDETSEPGIDEQIANRKKYQDGDMGLLIKEAQDFLAFVSEYAPAWWDFNLVAQTILAENNSSVPTPPKPLLLLFSNPAYPR